MYIIQKDKGVYQSSLISVIYWSNTKNKQLLDYSLNYVYIYKFITRCKNLQISGFVPTHSSTVKQVQN